MFEAQNNGTTVCFGELLSKDRFNLKKKTPRTDPEIVKNFVVFEAISVQSPRDFVVSSNTINN